MRPLLRPLGLMLTFVLAACGGGNPMPAPDAVPDTAAMAQALSEAGPSMAEVLSRPRPAAMRPEAISDGPTVRRLDGSTPAPTTPDLIWFNSSTGQTVSWTVSGTQVLATNTLYQSTDLQLRTTADLDGDGQEDLLREDRKTGRLIAWIMKGAATGDIAQSRTLLQDPAWRLVQTGDFNGDGRDDLVLANEATGEVAMWLMNGTTMLESQSWYWAAGWRVIAVADVNGDGRDDLIWDNRFSGETSLWLMSGTAIQVSGVPWSHPPGMQVRAAADIAGDGLAELLVDGALPNGPQALQVRVAAPPMTLALVNRPSDWPPKPDPEVMAVADLFGTGVNTVLWRQGGLGFTWASRLAPGSGGFTRREWAVQILKTDPAWRIDRAVDLDGDHKADLLWRKASTGQVVAALMDGLDVRREAELLADPAWTLVAVRQAIRRPIARIEADVQARPGQPMKLDGSTSQARSRAPLSYAWTLLEKPFGSQAVLSDPSAARPQFTPDVEGSYRFGLVVTAGGWASKMATTSGGASRSVVTQAAIEPDSHIAGAASNLRLHVRLTRGMTHADTLTLQFPLAYGDLTGRYWWFDTQRFDVTVQRQSLELKLRAAQAELPPGSEIGFDDLAVRYGVPHPAGPGTYVFKVWTTRDPGAVEMPLRLAAANTRVTQAQYSRADTVFFHRNDHVFEFSPSVPLQAGSRVFVTLPDSLDISGARLATASNGLSLDASQPRQLAITVWDPALIEDWAQRGRVRLAVSGIVNPACNNDSWTLDFQTSEDTLRTSIPVAPSASAAQGVLDPRIEGRLDSLGQWFWRVSFTAPGGLPAGTDVLMKFPAALMQQRDSDGSAYAPVAEPRPHPDCPLYRRLPVTANRAVAPGGRFDWAGSTYLETLRPPPPGNYEVELYTTVDSRPVVVPVTVPAR